ncbi:L,D-transpeptidase family protein [Thiohalocapsa marina]|uniref:L,D-transpeptidase family protein n=1 Tax=Thiohalocapsa marina TaxID=424902 RepID=A0A5M8FF95_9GAMM|nr:L,D-transpeptidase family protein [Thiohalocapsa marina]
MRGRWLFGLAVVVLSLALSLPAVGDELLRQEVEHLESAKTPTVSGVPLFSGRLLGEVYRERAYRAAWDQARAEALQKIARRSIAHGFVPDDFHATAIARIIDAGQLDAGTAASARAAAEILLSDSLLRYIHHRRFGKYSGRQIDPDWIFVDRADAEALKSDMQAVLASPDLASALTKRLPNPSFYQHLKSGYRRYLQLADAYPDGWEPIASGTPLRPGMRDARVPLIRQRLVLTEDYPATAPADAEVYDEPLADAIRQLQARSGLAEDGVVGPNTLWALNLPISDRLRSIRANLERMRWLYNELSDDFLLVDVAGFRLHLIRDGQTIWTTPIIVGTAETQTPMFRDAVEHIVFNPTWAVPSSIQKTMQHTSDQFRVIDRSTGRAVSGVDGRDYKRYRLVQAAGPDNALGQVKFMFPNRHAIYLHDTPAKHLFGRSARTYSHGCIRVREPLTLAELLLGKHGWSRDAIDGVVAKARTRDVQLDEHLPVLLYYLTAMADDQGRVGFRRDVYGRDLSLFAALDGPAHQDRITFPQPDSGLQAAVSDAEP